MCGMRNPPKAPQRFSHKRARQQAFSAPPRLACATCRHRRTMLHRNRPALCARQQRSAARAGRIVGHSLPTSLWPASGNLFRFPWTTVEEEVPPGPAQQVAEELEQELGWRRGFLDDYKLRHCLGRGSVGEIRVAVHRQSGQEFAVKTMSKVRRRFTRQKTLDKIRREANMLRRLQSCSSVARLVEAYEEAEEVHLVQELCRGGDLMKYIETHGSLDERSVARVALQAVRFLHSCHEQGILYGDLKPANCCLVSSASPSAPVDVRVVDFGNTVACSEGSRLSKRRGTLTFLSPEAYAQSYGLKADLWSLGVMLYWLYSRRYPFWTTSEPPTVATVEDMAALVSTVPIPYDAPPFTGMSPEGLDFIQRCLERDEAARLSAEQALQHPWVQAAQAAEAHGAAQAC